MPRDANGNMTLVAGNPVVTRTAISSTMFNATIADLAAEIQDSLSRSGKGGMNTAMLFTDGTEAGPGIAFSLANDTGIRRVAIDGSVRIVVSGGDVLTVSNSGITTSIADIGVIDRVGSIAIGTTNGTSIVIGRSGQIVSIPSTLNVSGGLVINNTANTGITIRGSKVGADSGADIVLNSSETRTAGLLLEVENNTAAKFRLDYNGEPSLQGGYACGIGVKTDSDQVESAGTFTNVTSMSFPVEAGGQYIWEVISPASSNTVNAVEYRFTGPAGPTYVVYTNYDAVPIASAFSTTMTVSSATNRTAITSIKGILINGVNAGTVQLQFARAVAGSATWHRGSFLRWRRVA